MLPARYPGFSPAMRGSPAIRTIVTIAVAALIGTVVGGLSVLGVVVAVVQPSNHELRTDAGRDDGAAAVAPGGAAVAGQLPSPASSQVPSQVPSPAPGQVQAQRQADPPASAPAAVSPVAAPKPPAAPGAVSPMPPQPAAAVPPQPAQHLQSAQTQPAQPPQPQATQGPQITWPDALTRRSSQERVPQNPAQTPNPQASPAQSAAAPAKEPASEQGAVDRATTDRQDAHRDADKVQPPPANHAVASRAPTTIRVSPYDMPAGKTPSSKRVVTTPQIESPAPPDVSAAAAAPPDAPRSLFDFFGGGQFRDDRDAGGPPDASRQQALPEPPLRDTRGGARRVVRQQRHDEPAELEQRAPEPASDHWGGFFGGWHRDNWNNDN